MSTDNHRVSTKVFFGIDCAKINHMKDLMIRLFFVCVSPACFAQEYSLSELIPIQHSINETDSINRTFIHSLFLFRNNQDTLAQFTINNEDCDFSHHLQKRRISGIDEYKGALILDLYYTCCATTLETHYFLITKDDKIQRLNPITNISYDNPKNGYDLIFPDDLQGTENTIFLGKKYIDSCGDLTFVDRIQTIYPNQWLIKD